MYEIISNHYGKKAIIPLFNCIVAEPIEETFESKTIQIQNIEKKKSNKAKCLIISEDIDMDNLEIEDNVYYLEGEGKWTHNVFTLRNQSFIFLEDDKILAIEKRKTNEIQATRDYIIARALSNNETHEIESNSKLIMLDSSTKASSFQKLKYARIYARHNENEEIKVNDIVCYDLNYFMNIKGIQYIVIPMRYVHAIVRDQE